MGLEIGSGVVRAAAVWPSGSVDRVVEVEVVAGLRSAVRTALGKLPRRRLALTPVSAAVGPDGCQVKSLLGLPELAPELLSAIVRENQARFFLRTGTPLLTTSVTTTADGARWAAAFDEPLVEAVASACRLERCRLVRVLPAVLAVGSLSGAATVQWADGRLMAEATRSEGRLVSVTRRRLSSSAPLGGSPIPALARCGPHYAAAYAAAVCRTEGLPTLRRPRAAGAETVPRRRRLAAIGVFMSAAAGTAIVPSLLSRYAAAQSRSVLVALAPSARVAASAAAELVELESAVVSVREFGRERGRASALLADLARVLPESTAIVALRLDSARAQAVIVSRHAQGTLSALEQARLFRSPEVVGPVTRESFGGPALERFTVALRVRAAGAAP